MITVTRGDTAPWSLALKKDGVAHDLTGATFESYLQTSTGTLTIPNAQHAIVSAVGGTITITPTALNTVALALGVRDVVTKVTQGASVIHFRGANAIQVYPAFS